MAGQQNMQMTDPDVSTPSDHQTEYAYILQIMSWQMRCNLQLHDKPSLLPVHDG
jgi:hypothetical protein